MKERELCVIDSRVRPLPPVHRIGSDSRGSGQLDVSSATGGSDIGGHQEDIPRPIRVRDWRSGLCNSLLLGNRCITFEPPPQLASSESLTGSLTFFSQFYGILGFEIL